MEISRHWRIRKERYNMVGGACPNCEFKTFPAREICPNCGHGSHISLNVNDSENVYAQSVVVLNHALSA